MKTIFMCLLLSATTMASWQKATYKGQAKGECDVSDNTLVLLARQDAYRQANEYLKHPHPPLGWNENVVKIGTNACEYKVASATGTFSWEW